MDLIMYVLDLELKSLIISSKLASLKNQVKIKLLDFLTSLTLNIISKLYSSLSIHLLKKLISFTTVDWLLFKVLGGLWAITSSGLFLNLIVMVFFIFIFFDRLMRIVNCL